MRKFTLHLGMLAALALPGTAAAQAQAAEEAPPILRLSFYMCNLNEIGPVMDEAESMEIPIWDELVDEGMIQSYGYFVHAWASEWNVGIYTIAESIEAVIAATEEAASRIESRYPDAGGGLNEACPFHRDGFYTLGPSTGQDDEGDGGGS